MSPWLLALALAGTAGADEVVLRNGSKLEGAVREEGNKVVVDVGPGTVTLDRSEVRSINRPEGEIQEFDRRVCAIKPDDANGYYQTYLWARQQPGMKTRAESLLRKALEADPNHEASRRALGYLNYKGAWLTQEEYKAALGLVRYNGEWVSADAAARMKKMDQELMLASGQRAVEEERLRQQSSMERERIAARQWFLNQLSSGEVPSNFASALGYPWAFRYWGPAAPVTPQPNAD
jgi:hypothetical protein